jgi:hypothetical protein
MKATQGTSPNAHLATLVSGQLKRMAAMVVAIIGLVIYAHDFVWAGFRSNIYLNGIIAGLFIFGIVLSFRRTLAVRNDAIAFAALEEAYGDTRTERVEGVSDPYWRHYRAMKPGVVFARPSTVGHMFDLAYDEVLKNRDLKISVATLQNVTHGIDNRLADERSLVTYLAGLLIFLGLIGTFIGLMEMVGSIGGVISSISGASGNPTETMQRLLSELQKPLSGMAMGFSSSLFGLFGSLTLGLLARFGSRCQNGLKEAFEGWLASVAHLETGSTGNVGDLARLISDNLMGNGTGEKGSGGGSSAGISDVGMVATMAQGFSRMQTALEAMNTSMPRLIELQTEQMQVNRAMLASVDRLVAETMEGREAVKETRANTAAGNEHLQEIIQLGRTNEQRLTSGFNGMAHVMEVTGQAYLDGLRRLTAENYETNARLAKLLDMKAASDKITEIASSIESKVKGGVGTMTVALERTATSLELGLQKMSAEQAELRQVLQLVLANGGVGKGGGTSPEFEERLTAGFTELSRSMETVFAAYAQIVNRSLVANAMGVSEGGVHGPALSQQTASAVPEREAKPQTRIDIDHEEMRRRLYSTAMTNLRDPNAA